MNSMTTSILSKLFETHRLVFWYDAEKSLLEEFEALALPDVEKLVIDNNEFGIKVKVLHEQPTQKFLLYHSGSRPEDEANWLLDLLLANTEFCTDEASLVLSDLGLDRQRFLPFVQKTMGFFRKATKRVNALRPVLDAKTETEQSLAMKMMALCIGLAIESRIDHILMELFNESMEVERQDASDEKWKLLRDCGLEEAFWTQMRRVYGYASDKPSLFDFALSMFKDACSAELGIGDDKTALFSTARSFLRDWRDNQRYAVVFEHVSRKCASVLQIPLKTSDLSLKDFGSFDVFADIDERVLQLLAQHIEANSMSRSDIQRIISTRRNTHWYNLFQDIYEALDAASTFLSEIPLVKFEPSSADDAILKYSQTWYRLDRSYREFVYYTKKSADRGEAVLHPLVPLINGKYANQVVLPMNNAFQKHLDELPKWKFSTKMQADFYRQNLTIGEAAKRKVFVIISDALRYEVATELLERIQETNRYTVSIAPMVATLPSYTKLGMAALLPHKEMDASKSIAFADKLPEVLVDGKATASLEDRKAIIAEAVWTSGGTAIRAEELLSYTREQVLELQRCNRVVYVFHNEIDATGDALKSEAQVFEAASRTVETLLAIIKKLAAPNHVKNYLITSDHGFLYQDSPVDESDFLFCPQSDEAAEFKSRRFLMGHNLPDTNDLMTFDCRRLCLGGDVKVQIPRSVNRLHLSGSGSRYTHGGASLQEIVVPLLQVQFKPVDDTEQVMVELLHEGANRITTGQLVVRFFQTKPVAGKVLGRTLRIGIYTKDGKTLLSNQQVLTFDSESKQADDRLTQATLILNHQADAIKNEMVCLVIESRIGETAHYEPYKTEDYLLMRTFTNDFDF
ncbi:MAG: BREX-1 system phosphatase PglZ type A [Victivallales bacterium]|nr:BREX-1 system phosphatase PglZ type A [Victivallales bacterium]